MGSSLQQQPTTAQRIRTPSTTQQNHQTIVMMKALRPSGRRKSRKSRRWIRLLRTVPFVLWDPGSTVVAAFSGPSWATVTTTTFAAAAAAPPSHPCLRQPTPLPHRRCPLRWKSAQTLGRQPQSTASSSARSTSRMFLAQQNHPLRVGTTSTGRDGIVANIDVVQGPFHPNQLVHHWGRAPLLVRQAFDAETLWNNATHIFSTWNDLLEMVSVDNNDGSMGESARLVHHIPGRLDSFQLEWGPFEIDRDECGKCTIQLDHHHRHIDSDPEDASSPHRVWTVLLNDVDRHLPPLADWLDETFGTFLPRWRRDDAQLSLARTGGGIGPHVDNYDVFLIQTCGRRQWNVGLDKLSTQQEFNHLIPNLDVRILQLEYDVDSLDLDPGDMLYLPPRYPHEGTALSDRCQTLSVGCRAPSAAELVARLAEIVATSIRPAAHARYTEVPSSSLVSLASRRQPAHRSDDGTATTLSSQVKNDLKALVKQAVHDVLDDETVWDELVGKTVTEALRYTPEDVLLDTPSGSSGAQSSSWRRRPGVSIATSQLTDGTVRLFCHGDMWETREETVLPLLVHLERGQSIEQRMVEQLSQSGQAFWRELVKSGVVLPEKGHR